MTTFSSEQINSERSVASDLSAASKLTMVKRLVGRVRENIPLFLQRNISGVGPVGYLELSPESRNRQSLGTTGRDISTTTARRGENVVEAAHDNPNIETNSIREVIRVDSCPFPDTHLGSNGISTPRVYPTPRRCTSAHEECPTPRGCSSAQAECPTLRGCTTAHAEWSSDSVGDISRPREAYQVTLNVKGFLPRIDDVVYDESSRSYDKTRYEDNVSKLKQGACSSISKPDCRFHVQQQMSKIRTNSTEEHASFNTQHRNCLDHHDDQHCPSECCTSHPRPSSASITHPAPSRYPCQLFNGETRQKSSTLNRESIFSSTTFNSKFVDSTSSIDIDNDEEDRTKEHKTWSVPKIESVSKGVYGSKKDNKDDILQWKMSLMDRRSKTDVLKSSDSSDEDDDVVDKVGPSDVISSGEIFSASCTTLDRTNTPTNHDTVTVLGTFEESLEDALERKLFSDTNIDDENDDDDDDEYDDEVRVTTDYVGSNDFLESEVDELMRYDSRSTEQLGGMFLGGQTKAPISLTKFTQLWRNNCRQLRDKKNSAYSPSAASPGLLYYNANNHSTNSCRTNRRSANSRGANIRSAECVQDCRTRQFDHAGLDACEDVKTPRSELNDGFTQSRRQSTGLSDDNNDNDVVCVKQKLEVGLCSSPAFQSINEVSYNGCRQVLDGETMPADYCNLIGTTADKSMGIKNGLQRKKLKPWEAAEKTSALSDDVKMTIIQKDNYERSIEQTQQTAASDWSGGGGRLEADYYERSSRKSNSLNPGSAFNRDDAFLMDGLIPLTMGRMQAASSECFSLSDCTRLARGGGGSGHLPDNLSNFRLRSELLCGSTYDRHVTKSDDFLAAKQPNCSAANQDGHNNLDQDYRVLANDSECSNGQYAANHVHCKKDRTKNDILDQGFSNGGTYHHKDGIKSRCESIPNVDSNGEIRYEKQGHPEREVRYEKQGHPERLVQFECSLRNLLNTVVDKLSEDIQRQHHCLCTVNDVSSASYIDKVFERVMHDISLQLDCFKHESEKRINRLKYIESMVFDKMEVRSDMKLRKFVLSQRHSDVTDGGVGVKNTGRSDGPTQIEPTLLRTIANPTSCASETLQFNDNSSLRYVQSHEQDSSAIHLLKCVTNTSCADYCIQKPGDNVHAEDSLNSSGSCYGAGSLPVEINIIVLRDGIKIEGLHVRSSGSSTCNEVIGSHTTSTTSSHKGEGGGGSPTGPKSSQTIWEPITVQQQGRNYSLDCDNIYVLIHCNIGGQSCWEEVKSGDQVKQLMQR